ncbi:Lrp/AsnC family transcriptional regulator [Flavobacterium sp. CS20]|uniref:Lrp/AsnC family transcriptional regulator n=1 Tax=Flavobacterium sp. CS20 TaxID=2775246 RepID=UPI001B3A2408|nr:Lrp/AsnC family transcriptional regulator [Flavobacterium sp. CS20]QTY27399.1 Lrp/AsnC family transcriptional regulator [Flavobacterium sp. CS20]
MTKIDERDKQILMLLQTDANQTTKQIVAKIKLSQTAVYERIKRLEREKLITNYVALLDLDKVEKAFTTFCMVKLVNHTKKSLVHFEKDISTLDEITECYHISGEYDYLLKVNVKNIKAYRQFMVEKLTSIPFISSTQSAFNINTVKYSTAISLT